jgi:hypothetical protein
MCGNDWGSQKQGGHKIRPYEKNDLVGANRHVKHALHDVVALARTTNGTNGATT